MAAAKRASKAEMADRETFVHRLMDMGISRQSILGQLQKRFDLSRSQAFKIIATVASDRQSDGFELPTPRGTECLKESIGLLHSAAIDAAVDGDHQSLCKLSKEVREVCKALGIGAALGGAQPNGSIEDQIDPPMEVVTATTAMKQSR